MPAPKRSVALIVIVLLVDLALAGAGAYMLVEGLRAPSAEPPTSTGSGSATTSGSAGTGSGSATTSGSAGSSSSAATATPAAMTPTATPIVGDAAVATPVDAAPTDLAVAAGSGSAVPEKKTVKSRSKKKPRPTTKKPVDPYDDGPPLGIPPARPDPDS